MKKTALIIMIITVLSKLFGFLRELTLSYFYGASNISDAYLISITIPNVIFGFVATGLAAGFIPMYNSIANIDGEIEADRFTSNLVNTLVCICTVVVIFGLLFSKGIVKIFASGFEGDTLAIASRFTNINLFAIYFSGMISVFGGYLQIKKNYIIPALIGIPLNVVAILSIILSNKTSIMVLAVGYVISVASQVLLMIPFMKKKGYRYKTILNIKDKYISSIIQIALPVLLGVSVNQINILVDRTIASQIAVGGISALNYASRLNGFVLGIFVLSITTVLYPIISKMAVENNMAGLKQSLSEAMTGVNLLVVPATLGSMIFAAPIVSILFGRGAFDANAMSMTSSALFFYSVGMVGFGQREVIARAFYSMQDTKTPMINAAIGMTLNIVLNLILSRFMGIGGLALATSIAAIFTTILLFISLRRKIGPYNIKKMAFSFLKITFASTIMAIVAKLLYGFLLISLSQLLALFSAIGAGVIVYFGIIYFMKIDDVDVIVEAVKRKLKKNSAS